VNNSLGSVPVQRCRVPLGNMRSRLMKNVPGPATRFTSRPGYSVISAWAVSIAVLPPPITHTGPLLVRIASPRTSQSSGDTDLTLSLEMSSGSFGTMSKPFAFIRRFAWITSGRPSEDLAVIRKFPGDS